MLVCGCAVGPDFHHPESPKTDRYTEKPMPKATPMAGGISQHFASNAKIPAEWWTLFHSPGIDALVRQALEGSPNLHAAQATLRQAQDVLTADTGLEFPQVDLNAGVQRQRFSPAIFGGTGSPSIFSLYNSSVQVSYGLDLFGGLRRQIEAQKAQVEYEKFQLEGAYLALTANVVTAAVTEASLRGQIRATRDIIASEKRQLDIVDQQLALGGISRSVFLLQKTQLAQTRASLPPLEKSLSQVRHQLAVYVGQLPSEAKLPTIELGDLHLPENLPVSLPSKLARQRPDIRAAEALLHQASAKVGVATANLYPQISLTASIGTRSISSSSLFSGNTSIWNLAGNIVQPVFHGGQLRAQKQAAIAAFDQAAAQYRSTVLHAFQNVADALRALDSDAATLKDQIDAESSAGESMRLAQRQFDLGAVSYLTLLTAQRQYQQNRIASIAAQAARLADSAALLQALGGGWWNNPKDPNGEVSDD